MFQTSTAYLLWLIGFGVFGIHRFYLGRIGTGLLWLLTGGLFGIGALIDLFYIPAMVRQENLGLLYRRAMSEQPETRRSMRNVTPASREPLEKVILRLARRNRGPVTPAEVALEGDIPLDDAKAALGKLATAGHAEVRARESGGVVYVLREFERGV